MINIPKCRCIHQTQHTDRKKVRQEGRGKRKELKEKKIGIKKERREQKRETTPTIKIKSPHTHCSDYRSKRDKF